MENLQPLDKVFLGYIGQINIGSNKQPFNVLFDSGSCQTWIQNYDGTGSTSYVDKNQKASTLTYDDGTVVQGKYVSDSLSIGNLTVPSFALEIATSVSSTVGSNTNGLVGLCHSTNGTFMDEVVRLGLVKEKYFAYSISQNMNSAEIQIGSLDNTKYTGSLLSLSVSPSSIYWASQITGMETTNSEFSWKGNGMNVIFDTGTSMLVMPSDMSRTLNKLFNFSSNEMGVYVGNCPSSYPATIEFAFGTVTLTMQMKNLIFADQNGACYSGIMDGDGNTIIFGNAVLRNFYTVFNGGNNTISFAANANTDAGVSSSTPSSSSLFGLYVVLFFVVAALGIVGTYMIQRRRKRTRSTNGV